MGTPCGLTSHGRYAAKHNPFVYFDDINGWDGKKFQPSDRCNEHVVDYSQLDKDIAANDIPKYVFITPNLDNDMHDGSVSFLDVIYFTMISATTTGYGDIVPVTDRTRLFDAIVVTPIRILFLLILRLHMRRLRRRRRRKRLPIPFRDIHILTIIIALPQTNQLPTH